jgi:hypothetical protein
MDADGDGKVFAAESAAYFARQIDLTDSRVIMSTFVEGRNLFDILDVNRDGRLNRREFGAAADRLGHWDVDSDSQLSVDEIPAVVRVEFGRATADIIAAPQGAAPTMQTGAAPSTTTSGPVWFQKMDRNQDGDVSEREFLGPPSAFETLDRNGDRLIDGTEAKALQEKTKGMKPPINADERR